MSCLTCVSDEVQSRVHTSLWCSAHGLHFMLSVFWLDCITGSLYGTNKIKLKHKGKSEASSKTRALASARCTGVRLYTL